MAQDKNTAIRCITAPAHRVVEMLSQIAVSQARRLELITIALLLTLTLSGLNADLLVVLLEGSQILTGLRELTLLHTLTDVPVDEGTLGVHKIELVVDPGEDLGNGGGVGDHAHGRCTLARSPPG